MRLLNNNYALNKHVHLLIRLYGIFMYEYFDIILGVEHACMHYNFVLSTLMDINPWYLS